MNSAQANWQHVYTGEKAEHIIELGFDTHRNYPMCTWKEPPEKGCQAIEFCRELKSSPRQTPEKRMASKEFAEAIKGHRNSVVQGTGEKESSPMGFWRETERTECSSKNLDGTE